MEYLEALIATAPLGRPTLVSIIRQAVDDFIRRELSKPEVKARVERTLKDRRKVVNLRDVKRDK